MFMLINVPIQIGYKPPFSHHDKNSDKCISRMDHFCPWMNNAIGAKNQKNFFLFLIYTDLAALYAYILVAIHLVIEQCELFKITTIPLNFFFCIYFTDRLQGYQLRSIYGCKPQSRESIFIYSSLCYNIYIIDGFESNIRPCNRARNH